MSNMNIAILEPGYADYGMERSILGPLGATIIAVREDEDAVSALKEINPVAIMVRERTVSVEEIDANPNLKVIVRYGIGVDNIDQEAARKRKIFVANIPDYGAENEVSDQALALYLAVQRHVAKRDHEVRSGKWELWQGAPIPGRLNATLGIIGFGRIGAIAAKKFSVFGFDRILVVDSKELPEWATSQGYVSSDLDTLCKQSDVISLHVPLIPDTRHILNAERIGMMKPSTIVVNVSRGGLIDEIALAEAIKTGKLFGAGLDVFEHEPPTPDHPLFSAGNVVFSDHTAWHSTRTVEVLQKEASVQVAQVLNGKPPENWLNIWTT